MSTVHRLAATEVPGCEYALCQREAELRVQASPGVEPLLVCGLHVTPVLTWGVVPDADATIEHLSTRPEVRRARRDPAA